MFIHLSFFFFFANLKPPNASFLGPLATLVSNGLDPGGESQLYLQLRMLEISYSSESDLEGSAGAWSCSHHPRRLAHRSGREANTCQAVHGCGSRLLRARSCHTVENELTPRRAHSTVCLHAGLLSQHFVQERWRLACTQEPDVLVHPSDHFVHWMFPSTETRYLLLVKNANTLTRNWQEQVRGRPSVTRLFP